MTTISIEQKQHVTKAWFISFIMLLTVSFSYAGPLDTWHRREVPFLLSPRLSQVAYGNGVFVALGEPETLLTSADGTEWFWHFPPFELSDWATRLSFLNNRFYATYPLATSSDGIAWTNHNSEIVSQPELLSYGNGVFVGAGRDLGPLLISLDGIAWTNTGQHGFEASSIAFGNGLFVAVGHGHLGIFGSYGMILTSSNGLGWTYRRVRRVMNGDAEVPRNIIYGNGRFLVQGYFGHSDVGIVTNILTSSDGLSWTPHIAPGFISIEEDAAPLAFGGGTFVMGCMNNTNRNPFIASSVDGENWIVHDLGTNYNRAEIRSLAYGNGTFVAVADNRVEGFILQSDNLASGLPVDPPSLALKSYAGLTVTGTIGRKYAIESTTDFEGASGWLTLTNIMLRESPFLWVDSLDSVTPKRFYRARDVGE